MSEPHRAEPERRVALVGAEVFDSRNQVTRKVDVLLRGDVIESVGEFPKEGVDEVPLAGCTLLPGFINLHEHFTLRRTWGPVPAQMDLPDEFQLIRGIRSVISELRQGFTTVRELGAKNHLNLYLKRAVNAGMMPGPRILAAGAPLAITGGQGWRFATEVDGPEEVRHAVRSTAKLGADWIKLLSSRDPVDQPTEGQYTRAEFSDEELQSAVTTAHALGMRVAAHAIGRQAIGRAIQADVDTIEHGIYMDRELADGMIAKDIGLIPTISGYRSTSREAWSRGDDWGRRHGRLVEPHEQSTRTAIEAGVTIGIGTDTVGDLLEELSLLHECGLSTGGVLSALTLTNARLLGLEESLGVIEPGYAADLVAVRGDPLVNLKAIRDVEYVIVGGVVSTPANINLWVGDESSEWNALQVMNLE